MFRVFCNTFVYVSLIGDRVRRKLFGLLTVRYFQEFDLKKLVRFKFNERLDVIAGGNNLEEIVFNLIDWAERQGKLRELVKALCQERSRIQEFKKIKALWQIEETFNFEVVTVNSQGQITNRSSKAAKFFTEDLGNGVTLEMVSIPGGSFKMGSPPGEKELQYYEEPQHTVNLPAFFMGKFEVTQEQYQQVMGENPSYFKENKRPVETVSWNDAVGFCQKLSEKTGRTYRLPSEAEWEYACRAGTTTPFYFGETITTDLVNYNANYSYASEPKGIYRDETTEVGKFPPNAFGLYDMHGNLWEWCQDNWHSSYEGAPKDGSAWIDNDNHFHVLRGGCWHDLPACCRSASRNLNNWADRDFSNINFGFRVVCGVGRTFK